MTSKPENSPSGPPSLGEHFGAIHTQDAADGVGSLLPISDIAKLHELAELHQIDPSAYIKLLENLVTTTRRELDAAHMRIQELGGALFDASQSLVEEKNLRIAAEFAQTIDPLTGLGNLAAFRKSLSSFLAQDESQHDACIVFIDIDGLKSINDYYGHLAGNKLLLATTHLLRSKLRANDEIFRVGGDEITLVMRGKSETIRKRMLEMQSEAEKMHIRTQVGEDWKDVPLWGFSFGIQQIDRTLSADVNYKAADIEMYKNKETRKADQAALRAARTEIMIKDREAIRIAEWCKETALNSPAANDTQPTHAPKVEPS